MFVLALQYPCDHSNILVEFMQPTVCNKICSSSKHNLAPHYVFKKCNIKLASSFLGAVDWPSLFSNCVNIDEYWLTLKVFVLVLFLHPPYTACS